MLHLGLSGYDYKEWKGEGLFYPTDLPATKFLDHYATRYNSLEFHGAFKQTLSETSVQKWHDKTPEGFTVSPKMNQVVTHFKRLKSDSLPILKQFVERLEPAIEDGRLGSVYLQLHPGLKRDDDLLATFLATIPRNVRWSVEFQNETWNSPEVETILREHRVAWVATQTDEQEAQRRDTAPHVYLRLRKLSYEKQELKEWAIYIQSLLSEGKDCYVYCRHKDVEAPWKWADQIRDYLKT